MEGGPCLLVSFNVITSRYVLNHRLKNVSYFALLAQLAEQRILNPAGCGFESRGGRLEVGW